MPAVMAAYPFAYCHRAEDGGLHLLTSCGICAPPPAPFVAVSQTSAPPESDDAR